MSKNVADIGYGQMATRHYLIVKSNNAEPTPDIIAATSSPPYANHVAKKNDADILIIDIWQEPSDFGGLEMLKYTDWHYEGDDL